MLGYKNLSISTNEIGIHSRFGAEEKQNLTFKRIIQAFPLKLDLLNYNNLRQGWGPKPKPTGFPTGWIFNWECLGLSH